MILDDCYTRFINLDSRPDRLEHMINELNRIGINAERKKAFPWTEIINNNIYPIMLNRTPGAIGCHFSQVHLMLDASFNKKHAFVMEDDLIFCSDFKERMQHTSNYLTDKEWDVIFLGGTFHSPAFWHPIGTSKMRPNCSANIGRDVEPTEDPHIVRTYGAFSTHAYIVNVNSINKILDLFDRYIFESIGIDWLFIKIQPQLKCFAFVPGCVKQMDNRSDIGNGITMFSGFSKLNGTEENSRYWFQDKMSDFDAINFKWI